MFTVSIYDFHPVLLKFMRLWRYAQAVTDAISCVLSTLCCQCFDMPRASSSSGWSRPSIQIFKNPLPKSLEAGSVQGKKSGESQRSQQVLIDISPQQKASIMVESRSRESRSSSKKDQELKVKDQESKEKDLEQNVSNSSSSKCHKSREKVIPAVHHSSKKLNSKEIVASQSIVVHV